MSARRRPTAGDGSLGADDHGARQARYYDLDLVGEEADVELYLALAAAADGAVLELGAGSGRVAVPLAAAGHTVTAVDIDPSMLARARQAWQALPVANRRGALQTIEEDIIRLDLGRRFELVILALNTLVLLPGRDAQLAAMTTMAGHLSSTGRAVIDVWLPGPDDLQLYDGRLMLEWQREDPQTGETVSKLFSASYDAAEATATLRTFYDAWQTPSGTLHRLAREDRLSFLSAHELLMLARSAGLEPELLGGDYAMTDFGPGSERMILVCRLL